MMIAESLIDVAGLEQISKDLAAQLETLSKQYGPETTSLILGVERIKGLEGLVGGSICLFFLILLLTVSFLNKQKIQEIERTTYTPIVGIISASVIVLVLGSLTGLAYVWNWVAVFHPELAIAHDIVMKLTSHN